MESSKGDGCAAALRLWPEEGPAGSSGANLAAEGPGGGVDDYQSSPAIFAGVCTGMELPFLHSIIGTDVFWQCHQAHAGDLAPLSLRSHKPRRLCWTLPPCTC